jgi:spore maturation protein CgeB
MYPGSIDTFYASHPEAESLGYKDHYNLMLNDTTEFAGSYTRTLIRLGIDAECIITNDVRLQSKWKYENNISSGADLLFEQVKSFNPEILWIENFSCLQVDWFKKVREQVLTIKLIVGLHCAPYTRRYLEKLRNSDFVITCTPGIKAALDSEGLRTYMVYHAFDSDLLTRLGRNNSLKTVALTFSGSLITGSSFHADRINMIERLIRENINIEIYVTLEKNLRIKAKQAIYFLSKFLKGIGLGKLRDRFTFFEYGRVLVRDYSGRLKRVNRPPQYGMNMYKLIARSKIVLNIQPGIAGDYAGNMRMFEATGVGCCLLTDNKSNMKELFDTENEVVVYNDTDDCIRKVKWLLEHDEERERIAKAGQKKTLEFHTVENRCRTFIDILNNELNGNKSGLQHLTKETN